MTYKANCDSAVATVRKSDVSKLLPLVIPVVAAAILYWLAGSFVTKEAYLKDQTRIEKKLDEVQGDIKTLLQRK